MHRYPHPHQHAHRPGQPPRSVSWAKSRAPAGHTNSRVLGNGSVLQSAWFLAISTCFLVGMQLCQSFLAESLKTLDIPWCIWKHWWKLWKNLIVFQDLQRLDHPIKPSACDSCKTASGGCFCMSWSRTADLNPLQTHCALYPLERQQQICLFGFSKPIKPPTPRSTKDLKS